MSKLPMKQCAVQLTGPGRLRYNESKDVHIPGPHQILCRMEAVGLCFSDLKLLKQFTQHVRKGEIVSGIEGDILNEIPSYVPGEAPAVPGHETVVRIEEVGPDVKKYRPGERYLVQADYRWLKTESSNAAFGYNFEGALQEYVLMDERVITDPEGESMLIPVSDKLSASAAALIEPWACVEEAYSSVERRTVKAGGQMLIVCNVEPEADVLRSFFGKFGSPSQITLVGKSLETNNLQIETNNIASIGQVPDTAFDDILYFGSSAEVLEELFTKLQAGGLLNIILSGGALDRDITMPVGRVHYGGIRIVGTAGNNPAESMAVIPRTGEIRADDKINIVGAAGPMGIMHVIRNMCLGTKGISVYAGDVDEHRLGMLEQKARAVAQKNDIGLVIYNAAKNKPTTEFSYTVVMAPIPQLVADAIKASAEGGLINIFAGIPAAVEGKLDLDLYIRNRLYFVATSGSTLQDMKTVLERVELGVLDTNTSVAAVGGLRSAIEGIKAVENRGVAGKIVIYPSCKNLPLTELEKMSETLPQVAGCLQEGVWNEKAERALLKEFAE